VLDPSVGKTNVSEALPALVVSTVIIKQGSCVFPPRCPRGESLLSGEIIGMAQPP